MSDERGDDAAREIIQEKFPELKDMWIIEKNKSKSQDTTTHILERLTLENKYIKMENS